MMHCSESIKVSVDLYWVGWFAAEDDVMSYFRAGELPDTRGEGNESSSPWATTMWGIFGWGPPDNTRKQSVKLSIYSPSAKSCAC